MNSSFTAMCVLLYIAKSLKITQSGGGSFLISQLGKTSSEAVLDGAVLVAESFILDRGMGGEGEIRIVCRSEPVWTLTSEVGR